MDQTSASLALKSFHAALAAYRGGCKGGRGGGVESPLLFDLKMNRKPLTSRQLAIPTPELLPTLFRDVKTTPDSLVTVTMKRLYV